MLCRLLRNCLVFLSFTVLASAAQAQYYACVDKHGNTTYQQDPCKGEGLKQREVQVAEKQGAAAGAVPGGSASGGVADDFASGFKAGFSGSLSRLGVNSDYSRMEQRFNQLRQKQPWILSTALAMYIFSIWYGLRLLVLSFQQGFWWGMLYLFVPVIGFLVFMIRFWREAGGIFLLSVAFSVGGWALFLFAPVT